MQTPGSSVFEQEEPEPPCPEDIRAELERLLASPDLQASARRRAFLRYVVEETLAGRADRLKGYTVAVSVFARDETFDPQADPVVRLEARRLRRDLDSYYVDAGRRDPVRITIPKGSYVPHFEWTRAPGMEAASPEPQPADGADQPEATTPSQASPDTAGTDYTGSRLLVAVIVIALLAVAAVASLLLVGKTASEGEDIDLGPAVAVLPFDTLTTDQDNRYLASGLTAELVADLMRFPGFRLFTLPASFAPRPGQDPVTLGRDLGVAYLVDGRVAAEAGMVHVVIQLLNAKTGAVLWSGTFDEPLTPDSLISAQRAVAGEIASELGQPYGAVNADLILRPAAPNNADMQSYLCVLRAFDYRRSFSPEKYGPVLECLESAVRRDPDFGDAWAMLGWLYMDGGRFEFAGPENVEEQYQKGLEAGNRALAIDPDSTLALKALSAINHYMGRYDEGARLARRAVEINPYDPDTLAQLGWRLAVRGNFEEGIPILKRAIARTANPPGWYYHLVATDLYLKGDYAEMLEVAEKSAIDGSAFSQTLIAIAKASLGDAEGAREALMAQSPEIGPLTRSLSEFLRRHGATDDIVEAFVAGLKNAHEVAAMAQD